MLKLTSGLIVEIHSVLELGLIITACGSHDQTTEQSAKMKGSFENRCTCFFGTYLPLTYVKVKNKCVQYDSRGEKICSYTETYSLSKITRSFYSTICYKLPRLKLSSRALWEKTKNYDFLDSKISTGSY